MFIKNKYHKLYFLLVDRARARIISGYTEKHHIVPKCLGGTDDLHNLVVLTAREHYICHVLLTKMTDGDAKRKMIFAAQMMLAKSKNHNRAKINSRLYNTLRSLHAHEMSRLHANKIVSDETKKKMSDSAKGRPSGFRGRSHSIESNSKNSIANKGHTRNTDEVVSKIVKSRKGYTHSDETRQKISKGNRGKKMPPLSEEARARISIAHTGRPAPWATGSSIKCEHCQKMSNIGNYKRWHGDNCRAR